MKQETPVTATVVYIITKLELGGAQKVCLTLFENMPQHDINSFLISGTEGPLVEQARHQKNIILLDVLKREVGFSALLGEIKTFWRIVQQLKKLRQEHPSLIVHTHSTKAGILGRWAAWYAGIKKRIHTIHGFAFHDHQPRLHWYLIYFFELITSFITTHFVCVSSHDVTLGKKLFPRFAHKHSIIRAAIDWHQFYQPARKAPLFPTTQEPFIFGTVACFKPQKNIFDLLKAFHRVHQQLANTRLELVGDGALRPHIEQWIIDHNLEKVITLHGWLTHVAPVMGQWHAFTLSSLWEGLPCAVIEARLLNLPIISYDTGGIADVVFQEKNGFLAPQGDWQQLAHFMHLCATQSSMYEQLRNKQQDLFDFNHLTMVQRHANLYKQLHTK